MNLTLDFLATECSLVADLLTGIATLIDCNSQDRLNPAQLATLKELITDAHKPLIALAEELRRRAKIKVVSIDKHRADSCTS